MQMQNTTQQPGWFAADATCSAEPAIGRAHRIVLLGPPGVGKGTQAEMLSQALHACHLSTGELFRAARCDAHPSPAMSAALEAMHRGELVSDELVESIVRERAGCLGCHGGFLLDGFPRTVHQAEALEKLLAERGVELDAVICYELPREEIVARLSGRRTCPNCNSVFHVTARPPQHEDVCDGCGGRLIQRDDDAPEAIHVRMQAYESATQPLIDFYARLGKLIRVEASGTPEEIFRRTLQSFNP